MIIQWQSVIFKDFLELILLLYNMFAFILGEKFMTKTLYIMRHGQTLFNIQHKIQGWSDSPLTKKGIQQAKIAGQYFKDNKITFDAAFCSTAERASDTLELVTDMQKLRASGFTNCSILKFIFDNNKFTFEKIINF